jgi:hypothetical protein
MFTFTYTAVNTLTWPLQAVCSVHGKRMRPTVCMSMCMCTLSLQVQLDVAGLPVLLSDTAGLRAAAAAADDVEREGIKRAMVLCITYTHYIVFVY